VLNLYGISCNTTASAASTSVLWEADGQRRCANFVGKQVFLVEKENHRRVDEPTIVADGIKQLHAFRHSILPINTRQLLLETRVIITTSTQQCLQLDTTVLGG